MVCWGVGTYRGTFMQSQNKRRDREIIRIKRNRGQALKLLQLVGSKATEGLGVARSEQKGDFA